MNDESGGLRINPAYMSRKIFSEEYRDQIFWMWYRNNKVPIKDLYAMIDENEWGERPALATLENWLRDFRERAVSLDAIVQEKRKEIAIQEKMEMLERHAQHGKEMQEIALEHIRFNKEKLNMPTAVRMWVEGVRVERESRGMPTLIEKISSADDEQLMLDIEKLLNSLDLEAGAVDGDQNESVPDMQ